MKNNFVLAIRYLEIGSKGDSSMKRYALYLALFLLIAAVFASPPQPFDWPQWQGPERNAISKEKGLLQEWPQAGPALAWRSPALAAATVRLRLPQDKFSR
jgi:hypothetical protein